MCNALHQVARRIACVRDSQNLSGIGVTILDQAHQPAGQHRGLARPRASDHEYRSDDVAYGLLLFGCEFEFSRLPGHAIIPSMSTEEKAKVYYLPPAACGARACAIAGIARPPGCAPNP